MNGHAPPRNDDELIRRPAFLVVAAVLVAVGLVVPLSPPVNPDISWLSYSAGRFLEGVRPYVELIEINPPAILFFNLPAAWIADRSGLDGPTAYTLYVAAIGLASVASVGSLTSTMFDRTGHSRVLMLFLLLVLFTLTGRNFGQREHLMLILALPYLALVSRRLSEPDVPVRWALGAGLLAGVGLALKPHFLAIWLAVEAVLWRKGQGSELLALVRPETLALATVLLLYASSVPLLTPAYMPMVDALGRVYLGYLNGGLEHHLTQPAVLFAATGLVGWRLVSLPATLSGTAVVLGATSIAALVMAAVQLKGWSYHYYPAFALSALLLAALATRGEDGFGLELPGLARSVAAAMLAIAVVGGLAAVPAILEATSDRRERLDNVVQRIERSCESPRLVVFSPDAESAFPLATRDEFRWGLSISSLWPLSAVYEDQARSGAGVRWNEREKAPAAERFLRERIASDLQRSPPDLLLVDRAASERAFGEDGFGYLRYFAREPGAASVLAALRRVGDWSGYEVWVHGESDACAPLAGGG